MDVYNVYPFIVDHAHIDVLVNAMAQHGVFGTHAGQSFYRGLGQLLLEENTREVDDWYGEHNERQRYRLRTTEGDLDPLAVLKAIDCWKHQSGYRDCEANSWVENLREAIYTARPEYAQLVPDRFRGFPVPAYVEHSEFDRLPWGFTRLEDALVRHNDA